MPCESQLLVRPTQLSYNHHIDGKTASDQIKGLNCRTNAIETFLFGTDKNKTISKFKQFLTINNIIFVLHKQIHFDT